jgi:hypothetical protein
MKTDQLLRLCSSTKSFDDRVLCNGYILGIIDATLYGDLEAKRCTFALPSGADVNQVPMRVSDIIASAAAGGSTLPNDAALSVVVALHAAYPCPKD